MSRIFKTLVAMAIGLMIAVGCQPIEEPQAPPQLDVTPNNVAGSWKLTYWMGKPLAEGSYVYLDLVRSGRTYTMYQNMDSHYTRTLTGRYYIEIDEMGKAVIRGNYDHGVGEWNNRYIVTSLTANEMIWQAEGNPEDVSTYMRADIPAEIAGAAQEEN